MCTLHNQITIKSNLSVPWKLCGIDIKSENFKYILVINSNTPTKLLTWMPSDVIDDKPTIMYIFVWCHQSLRHWWKQYWSSSMMLHAVTITLLIFFDFLFGSLKDTMKYLHSWFYDSLMLRANNMENGPDQISLWCKLQAQPPINVYDDDIFITTSSCGRP